MNKSLLFGNFLPSDWNCMWEVKKFLGYQNDGDVRKPEVLRSLTSILRLTFNLLDGMGQL